MRWRAVRKGGALSGGAGGPTGAPTAGAFAFTCNVTAASLSETDVQAAINSATDGQTVCLPAGTAAWTSLISFPQDRSITVAGAGTVPLVGAATSGGTTITVDIAGHSVIALYEIQTSLYNPTIANITFNITQFGNRPQPPDAIVYCGGRGGTSSIPVSYNDKMCVIHHITVTQHDGVTGDVCGSGLCSVEWASFITDRGLVYRSKVSNEERWSLGGLLPSSAHVECKSNGAALNWASASNFGLSGDPDGNHNLYIEDSTFTNLGGGIDLDDGCKSVVRYNTFTDTNISDHGHDTSITGNRETEVYNNTFVCAATTAYDFAAGAGWYASRGGTYVITDNIAPQTCYSVTRDPWAATILPLYRDDLYIIAAPTGDLSPGSGTITNVSDTTNLFAGQRIIHAGFVNGTIINTVVGSTVTLTGSTCSGVSCTTGQTVSFLDCYPGPYPWLRQPGWGWAGSGDDTNQVLEAAYVWNNRYTSGGTPGEADVFNAYNVGRSCHYDNSSQTAAGYIQSGREYNLSVAKPSYTKYTYPHPLATFTGNP